VFTMRYHIAYGKDIRLKDGTVINFDDVQLHDEKHEYDVGTRDKHNVPRKGMELDYLEDFMADHFVVILEQGELTLDD